MTVYLVGAGPGDPGLLTRRAAEVLAGADVVVHDRLVPAAVLALAAEGALVVDVGKRPGEPRRQEEINALLVEHGRAGRTVVRLKGGDPFVFGRGGEEAQALRQAGVPFEVVPGVSAAFAAPAYAGVPVTQRGMASSVTVVTGRVGDAGAGGVDWEALARAGGTVVVLMGMEQRAAIAQRLMAGGLPPSTPVMVVQEGTTPAQRSVRTTLSQLHAVELGAPATIVVGVVAGLDLAWFEPGPLSGRTVVVTRAAARAGRVIELFEGAGAEVIPVPVVSTADPEDAGAALSAAMERAAEYDWIVFTSANAVERAVEALDDLGGLKGARLGVVGPATAAALSAYQVTSDVTADPATAEGLVARMPEAPAEGGTVLYPRVAQGRPALAEGLRGKGWSVDEVIAYRTVDAGTALPADVLDRAAAADVVTFTSPSTVEAYLRAAGRRPLPKVVACIGPVTAEAARRAGLTVVAVADEHSAEGLVHAVVSALSSTPLSP